MTSKNFQVKFVLYIKLGKSISSDKKLLDNYLNSIEVHNTNMLNNHYYESGFDLYHIDKKNNIKFAIGEAQIIYLDIKCACYKFENIHPKKIPVYKTISESYKRYILKSVKSSPLKIVPINSICEEGFLLANSPGIIDSSYRDTLFIPLYSMQNNNLLKYGNRYVKICMPGLERFLIKVVEDL